MNRNNTADTLNIYNGLAPSTYYHHAFGLTSDESLGRLMGDITTNDPFVIGAVNCGKRKSKCKNKPLPLASLHGGPGFEQPSIWKTRSSFITYAEEILNHVSPFI